MSPLSIGQKVKRFRELAGLSQIQIAQYLGIDQSTISKCEKGERHFQMDQLEQLSNLFGITLADLVNGEESLAPLQIAFRADDLQVGDLNAIADIHKIAMNLKQMRLILLENPNEA